MAVFQGDLTYVDVVEINRVFSLFCDTSIINNDLELSLLRQVLLAPLLNLRSLILLLTVLSVTCLFVFALFFVNYTVKERLIDNSLALNAEYSSRIAAHTNYQFEEILKNLRFSAKLLGQDFARA